VIWADGNYRGELIEWVRAKLGWELCIVEKAQGQKGFVTLPRRWVVERTIAWLNRYRRLSKDYGKWQNSGHGLTRLIRNPDELSRMSRPYCSSCATTRLARNTSLGYPTFCCSQCKRKFNERTGTQFNHLQFPTDIVLLVVQWRLRYKLSLRDLAEMFLARGFEFTHEAVRDGSVRFQGSVARIDEGADSLPTLGAVFKAITKGGLPRE
jgi:transposase